MRDGDHLTWQHGYVSPLLAGAKILQVLSEVGASPFAATKFLESLGIILTDEEYNAATTPTKMRKLLLDKLQERF